MNKLLIIDTETGGLDSTKNSLLSAAFGVWQDGELTDTMSVNIKHDVYHVTAKALEINKIDIATWEGHSPKKAKSIIEKFVEKHFEDRPTVVGQNVHFDINFLTAFFGKAEYDEIFSHRAIDTATIIRFLNDSGVTNMKGAWLDAAIEYFGIKIEQKDRHTAYGDVIATAAVYNQLLRTIQIKK